MNEKTLFIFRRDLRLHDNTGLLFALENAKKVIPCFIFTPQQIDSNPYRSDRCLQFMIESLEDLEEQLKEKNGKLHLFFGQPEEVVAECIEQHGIDAVVLNRDYTPYSIQRDKKIASVCKKLKIPFHSFDDALLHPPEETLKSDGKPYTIFTPYYKNAERIEIPKPRPNPYTHYGAIPFKKIYPKITRLSQQKGGRKEGLKILKTLKNFTHYDTERDFPALDATTHLSPHLKFTTLSPREVHHAMHHCTPLIRSLFWRDFFTGIALHFPYVFQGAFHKKFNGIEWENNKKHFNLWCEGKTGFPIIDAGMREMLQSGFMHNRVRMIVASFLVKDLHIDWRWGEKYFAQKLIDYDPAVNNGNWQWSASTGCDAQPYFRIFNPWNQQAKFDPDCLYIKKWIPELKKIPPKAIHQWFKGENWETTDYPPPLVDHSREAKAALKMYL